MIFISALALGVIVTQSTLLLLNIILNLDNDTNNAQHPPCHLQLGREKD